MARIRQTAPRSTGGSASSHNLHTKASRLSRSATRGGGGGRGGARKSVARKSVAKAKNKTGQVRKPHRYKPGSKQD